MAAAPPAHPSPRKRPLQRRARATLDAIFEATIQVLLRDGPRQLTTTRVAERGGVSVGTMYQYFPHKGALIHALNARYLDALAARIEEACQARHGAPLDVMVEALVGTYWQAKTERADVTRALYRSVVEIDNEAMVEAFAARVDAATAAMLASAPGAPPRDPARGPRARHGRLRRGAQRLRAQPGRRSGRGRASRRPDPLRRGLWSTGPRPSRCARCSGSMRSWAACGGLRWPRLSRVPRPRRAPSRMGAPRVAVLRRVGRATTCSPRSPTVA